MKTTFRDTVESLSPAGPPNGWRNLVFALTMAACLAIASADHVYAKYEKLKMIASQIQNGTLTWKSAVVMITIVATLAFVVAMIGEWKDFRRYVSILVHFCKRLLN